MTHHAGRTAAEWIAEFVVARGARRVYGLQGGHIQPIWDHLAQRKVRIVDVRDEGAAVHMAHAHAELTGTLGVAMVTAGPGVTNTVTAIANAMLARIPVLLIGGCTSRPQANMGPLQDIPHVDILRPVCNQARTLRVAEQVIRELDEGVVARARIVVDERAAAIAEAGDLVIPWQAGEAVGPEEWTELGAIAAGLEPGRQRANEITLFKSVGNAVQDVAVAALDDARARHDHRGPAADYDIPDPNRAG